MSLATFVLKGEVEHGWRTTCDTPYDVDVSLTWDMFLHTFHEYFILMGMRDAKMVEFLELTQGSRTIL